ncbi:MAG: MFS transporter [Desulfovibrio sp.]|jgi:MFS family permease|nr:MFS transporter [Desulfovibrio sp.]
MKNGAGDKVVNLSDAVISDEKITKDAWKITAFVYMAWVFDASDGQIFSLALPLIRAEFDLSLAQMGAIATMFLVGATIGSFLMPVVAEKYGRRWGMVSCVGIYSIFTGLVWFAQNAYHLIAARFATGVGTGGEWPVGAAYLSEVVPSKKRGLMMGFMQSGYPVGYFIAGGIFALFTAWKLDWRASFLVMAAPALLCFPILFWLKESPAWVENKKNKATEEQKQKGLKLNYSELFQPKWRKATILATAMHIVGGIWMWGINIWYPSAMIYDFKISTVETAFIIMLLYGVAIFGYLAAGALQDTLGRKKALALFITLAFFTIVTLNYMQTLPEVPKVWLYMTTVVLGLSLGTHSVLITYSTEIYPSHVRTLGIGFSIGVGKITAALCPTVMGVIADASSVTLALLVSSGIGWLLVPIILQGPETAGKKLEDITTS